MDIHATVTNAIIAAIESGPGTWQCPWHRSSGSGLPRNAATGRPYRGINVLSLWIASQTSGYPDSRWATYRQWQALGAQVRKGEKSSLIVFFKDYVTEGDDGQDEKRFVARASWAFNSAQVEGAPADEDPVEPAGAGETPAFDDLVTRTGATVRHGGEQACYVPSLDEIRMPARERFHSTTGYQSTLAHELVHWTGAKSRLDRDLSGRFRTQAYAAEELVAELGAAFTMATFGLASEPHPQHAAYIAGWLELLRSDNRAIFTAAAAASRAVDYLVGAP